MSVKTKINILPVLAIMLALLLPATALANGGQIIYADNQGPFNVVISRSPSPPTPEVALHLSILLTRASSAQKVTDATVTIMPAMPGMDMPGTAPVRTYRGQTENTYDADIPVAMEGSWNFQVTVISPQFGNVTFTISDKVEKPQVPWVIIVGILIGLPLLAGLTWFFLFRKTVDDEDEEESPGKKLSGKS